MSTEKIEEVGILAEAGATGLKQYSGYVQEEFHKDLQGSKAIQVYREMRDNHPLISEVFLLTDMISRQVEYRVEQTPEDKRQGDDTDSPMYEQARQFVEECLDDMSSHPTERQLGGLEEAISRSLSMAQFGYALQEKVFKIRRGDNESPMLHSKFDDGRIGLRKLAPRPQESIERWEFLENGTVVGVWQRPPPDYRLRFIPMDKVCHFRLFTEKDNPEGRSLLRGAYVPYRYQVNLQFIEAVGIERNIAGLPTMEVPPDIMNPNANAAQKSVRSSYEKMLRNVRVDGQMGLLIPAEMFNGQETGYKFKLQASSGKSFTEADVPIRRYRQEIVMALIAEHITTGQDAHGARSLRESATDMFILGVAGQLDAALDVFNSDLIPELLSLNGIPGKYAPHIARGDLETPDLGVLAQYVNAVVTAGIVTPTDKLEDHMLEVAHLPQADRDAMAPRGVTDMLTGPEPQMGQQPLPLPATPVVEEKEAEEPEPDDFLSQDQAAEMLGVPRSSIMRAVRNGKIPGAKIGNSYRIRRKDLMRYMDGGM